MKYVLTGLSLVLGLASLGAFAQAPAGAPAGSTGLCKDGSYTSNDTKKGACAGHKGVKDWFSVAAMASTAAAPTAAAPTGAAAATKPAAPTATAAPASTNSTRTAMASSPAAGGGPGQVWVNASSKVYHCAGTKYYGKTKHGEYMSEAAAKAAGNHADHGKACAP
ncbi:MAG: DUF3761 domain-containing protein [Ideonella sp.]